MTLKEVYLVELIDDQEYLFKDNRGMFYLGTYSNIDEFPGFYTDSYAFFEYGRIVNVWEFPN